MKYVNSFHFLELHIEPNINRKRFFEEFNPFLRKLVSYIQRIRGGNLPTSRVAEKWSGQLIQGNKN